ncbi:nuclease-related domain-containing protein [Aerococcaceae bacterium WGS1372]
MQEVFPRGWRILHNLNFDHSIRKIQIDALFVSPHGIYHFEVKNLVAECEYRDGEFYNLAKGYKHQNYFAQMKRQNELLMPILGQ